MWMELKFMIQKNKSTAYQHSSVQKSTDLGHQINAKLGTEKLLKRNKERFLSKKETNANEASSG